jgi:hypothetical protein
MPNKSQSRRDGRIFARFCRPGGAGLVWGMVHPPLKQRAIFIRRSATCSNAVGVANFDHRKSKNGRQHRNILRGNALFVIRRPEKRRGKPIIARGNRIIGRGKASGGRGNGIIARGKPSRARGSPSEFRGNTPKLRGKRRPLRGNCQNFRGGRRQGRWDPVVFRLFFQRRLYPDLPAHSNLTPLKVEFIFLSWILPHPAGCPSCC